MAINKELYERYKQLKAQGVNITLAELKSQIEREVNTAVNHSGTTQTTYSNEVNNPNSQVSKEDYTPTQQQNTWTTSYSTQAQQPQYKQQILSQSSDLPYTGNLVQTTEIPQNNSYMNQFTSAFTPQVTSNSISQQQEQYQGNISQSVPTFEKGTKFGLLGYPLGHSLSTYIHNAGFKSLNLDYTYEILETSPEKLVDRIKYLKANNYAGFNITIPLKIPIIMFLDELDSSADVIGAVNTVIINPDKTMKGYNTDVLGFKNAIPKDFPLDGKTAGVLGTGGAARAAITALASSNVKEIKIYTRNIPNSAELLNYLRLKFPTVEFNAYQIEYIRDLSTIDILVNCTPIGMQGRAADLTPIEENELKTLPDGALVYDVIYNPKKTVLLKLAEKNGYQTVNGVDMFIWQAVEAEKIWTGRTPDYKDMKIAALENL